MKEFKESVLHLLLIEYMKSKFTGKLILEVNFSEGGITKVYKHERKQIKEGVK